MTTASLRAVVCSGRNLGGIDTSCTSQEQGERLGEALGEAKAGVQLHRVCVCVCLCVSVSLHSEAPGTLAYDAPHRSAFLSYLTPHGYLPNP